MPRQSRKKSKSGIYHIVLRGINRQQIFEDAEDRARFLETLANYKNLCGYTLYAYCLMGNHIHLLNTGDGSMCCVIGIDTDEFMKIWKEAAGDKGTVLLSPFS